MSNLNGDSREIVRLLTAKIDDGNRQINQRFDDFKDYQDKIIESFNNYKNTTKQYIDMRHEEQAKELEDQKKLIDSHCVRVRKLESFRWWLLGIFAVIVSLGGLAGIINYLTK